MSKVAPSPPQARTVTASTSRTSSPARTPTAAEAVKDIRSGDRVWIHPGCNTPVQLIDAMVDRAPELENVEVVGEDHRWSYPTFDEAALARTLREALDDDAIE